MKTLSLNGNWKMRQSDTVLWHEALVPGSVYADLLRDGTLDDPFYRENELTAFPLMENDYEYTRSFFVDAELLSSDEVLLRCDGLDTLADVSLNGAFVAHADNMHRTWTWNVSPLLHAGENELTILFESPLRYIAREHAVRPCWGSTDATPGFSHLRKAHCMFGWDWGPRLPDAGIWRSISLLFVDKTRLGSVRIDQHHEAGAVTLRIDPEILYCAGSASSNIETRFSLTTPSGAACSVSSDGVARIEQPELWWPSGFGAQPLYTVRVTLHAQEDGRELDSWERRIGLRTLSISRAKDEWGEEFCHVVNGVKVFAMGADYIPEDNLFSRITPERTRRLLSDAKLANFNTVRIWGGGYYPDDFFFDICDELGLMVWQDLMFACAYYDLTPAFEESITHEIIDNVKRLRHHASLALICGNNEMEQFQAAGILAEAHGDHTSFGPARPSHHADYIKMFESLIPRLMERHAPQVFYWPASPSSGGAFDDPNCSDRGDVHYWDVWHGEKPFTEYRKFHFRYASEFGFQSFPCLPTVQSFTLPEDRNIFSRIMERHQRNLAANGKILSYLSQTYLYPTGFDQLLYCSQLLQADAIRYGVEHWRRNRGRCMGAIIWQLNDCWPVASWSSIDYFGRWKALHYVAKRFFAPVMISACEEGELTQNPKINEFHPEPIRRCIRLNVANEQPKSVQGMVQWALRNRDGSIIEQGEQALTIPALSSLWLDEMEFSHASLTESYCSFAFVSEQAVMSEGTALFCAPKHFQFADPALTVRAEGAELVVRASAFAKHVQIESEDPDLLLSDNFFDLNAEERRVQILRGSACLPRVRSVYDLGR